MTERLRMIAHRGHQIILEDFSGVLDEAEFIRLIREAQALVHRQPRGSARILIDLSNSHFTPAVSQVSKEVSASNTPYVVATALVGVSGLMPIVVRAIDVVTRRELVPFPTRDEALDWLVQQ